MKTKKTIDNFVDSYNHTIIKKGTKLAKISLSTFKETMKLPYQFLEPILVANLGVYAIPTASRIIDDNEDFRASMGLAYEFPEYGFPSFFIHACGYLASGGFLGYQILNYAEKGHLMEGIGAFLLGNFLSSIYEKRRKEIIFNRTSKSKD